MAQYKPYLFLLLLVPGFSACTDRQAGDRDKAKHDKPKERVKARLEDCIYRKDTLFDATSSLKYVIRDTFYDVRVQLENKDTMLGYRFDCTVPQGLVPAFYAYHKHTLCLLRGSGQSYREFTICYIHDGRMMVKYYETALAAKLEEDLVVYQDYNEPRKIIMEDIRTEQQKIVKLPGSLTNTAIIRTRISKNKLVIELANEQQITFRR
ncbi:hypothetical protein [Taibaiella chishuiensis]|uniref:Lipoprotein n=1 Tax=Taibaiella chishuiensis TaxID=1434707 RepID=A0A2P8D7C4_9BACT|nr:hypothetical protein [Taibaiella chishuiensis]PSK93099.1 hypothetical protein B0I18_10268 [Taibaiella chishuiensis]